MLLSHTFSAWRGARQPQAYEELSVALNKSETQFHQEARRNPYVEHFTRVNCLLKNLLGLAKEQKFVEVIHNCMSSFGLTPKNCPAGKTGPHFWKNLSYLSLILLAYQIRSTSPPCRAISVLTRFANWTAVSSSYRQKFITKHVRTLKKPYAGWWWWV